MMSISLKDRIFYFQQFSGDDVEFYRVTRSTTNTCEVVTLGKSVVYQNDDFQYVEPDLKGEGLKKRCKVISFDVIQFRSDSNMAHLWDGKPVKQNVVIFLPCF